MADNATKAHAAGLGAGVGASLATIIVKMWPNLFPSEIETAMGIVLTAVLAWGTTYLAPANQPK